MMLNQNIALLTSTNKTVRAGLLAAAIALLANASWIHVKAGLAQLLIQNAWASSLHKNNQSNPARPWPWADTWPVARLQYHHQTHVKDLYILAGAQGNSLAFGPGHLYGSSLPGAKGTSIVGGHRDTHFRFLEHVKVDDSFYITNRQGIKNRYQITSLAIEDSQTDTLSAYSNTNQLILVTCYPFNSLETGGSLRYVVRATLVPPIH